MGGAGRLPLVPAGAAGWGEAGAGGPALAPCAGGVPDAHRRACRPPWPQVEGGEEVAGVSTEAQREAFLAQLAEVEDWLYGDGEAVGAEEYR